MLNVHPGDGGIREGDGVRCGRQTYLADLVYLLERTGAVGLREVLMSDIWFAVDAFVGWDHAICGGGPSLLYIPPGSHALARALSTQL